MRVPLSWLQSLTPLDVPATDGDAVAGLASELDALGLVVERVERVGQSLSDVVLAQVVEISSIEDADRIRRVVVDHGSPERVEVVCGAWNFDVGDVVVLAPVGTELPGGMRIERRKMKGVSSNGMLCSPRELELGDDHRGIMVVARPARADRLPPGIELGAPLSDHLGFGPDVVFDLAVEANRPDCLSVLGVARDLSARFSLPLSPPSPVLTETGPPAAELASVEVATPALCRRLTARVLTGVSVVPSPAWLQRRLVLAGMRPIDCVVDASNYVMLELGQPTHPYDLDALGGRGLRVRAAHPGETIVTLDGEARVLGRRPPRRGDPASGLDGLICNADDVPVGIAGVMGGKSSEIHARTTSVLLEVAEFEPVAVGRTARWLGLRTEASARFERGVDPEGVERASARVCELVVAAAAAAGVAAPQIATGLLDDRPVAFTRTRLSLRPGRVNALLGTEISAEEMTALLEPIGYRALGGAEAGAAGAEAGAPGAEGGAAEAEGGAAAGAAAETAAIELDVPSWRPDVRREVDVIEDVARTFGYRRIPRSERRSPHVGRLDDLQQLRRRLRRLLCGLGAHEAWTSSIVDPAEHARARHEGALVRLANPLVAEESALRAGLLPGLLSAVRHNAGHRQAWLRLFELGVVFRPSDGELPEECERLALVLAQESDGARQAVHAWHVVEDALGLAGIEVRQDVAGGREAAAELAGLHPARSGCIVAELPGGDERLIGVVGEVDPDVLSAFGLPHTAIGWLDLDLARLGAAPRRPLQARAVSRYPSSDVDLAFSLDDDVPAARLQAVLRRAATDLCESVTLFDVYRGPGVEPGQRSLAYRLRFCASDHTLTDAEVADLRLACIEAAESSLPARLRA